MLDLTLTFDNGPDLATTPGVLDVLGRTGIRSTFFGVGEKLLDPKCRALAERARAEGHWIGNHSMYHRVPLGEATDPEQAASIEIGGTQHVLGALSHPDRLFRPFGRGGTIGPHLLSRAALGHLVDEHYTMVLWNAIPRDWAEPDAWVETALGQLAGNSWTLMVLHDLPTGAMQHLERFIDKARGEGVHFRQEFPATCLPIVRGKIVLPVDAYMPPEPHAQS